MVDGVPTSHTGARTHLSKAHLASHTARGLRSLGPALHTDTRGRSRVTSGLTPTTCPIPLDCPKQPPNSRGHPQQVVLNVFQPEYVHMFETLLATPQPWLYLHVQLPGGVANLGSAGGSGSRGLTPLSGPLTHPHSLTQRPPALRLFLNFQTMLCLTSPASKRRQKAPAPHLTVCMNNTSLRLTRGGYRRVG